LPRSTTMISSIMSHFWCGECGEKTWMFLIGFDLQI
jgi:hypothetical protein